MRKYFALNPGKLNQKYKSEQNMYLAKKLEEAKPLVNIKCPESFIFYKTKFHKHKVRNNLSN